MSFNFAERIIALAHAPITSETEESLLQECARIETDNLYIPSGYKWMLEYKRYQIESARRNRPAALKNLRNSIAQFPYNAEAIDIYRRLCTRDATTRNILLMITCKKYESKVLDLANQFDAADIEYFIVSGCDTAPIDHSRALQMNVPDNYESLPMKAIAAFTWVYENLGNKIGVLKVDDDQTLIDADKLNDTVEVLYKLDAYAGVPVSGATHDRNWHWGKCQDPALNTRTYGRPFWRQWAKGGAYYLGPGPLEKVVLALTRFPGLFEGEYYEDKLVGDVLMSEKVELRPLGGYEEFGLMLTDQHRFKT